MAISTSNSRLSPGAGRSFMLRWPGLGDTINDSSGVGAAPVSRNGVTSQVGISGTVAATGTLKWKNYAVSPVSALKTNTARFGSLAMQLLNAVAGDDAKVSWNQGPGSFEIEQLAAGVAGEQFARVYRIVARIAYPAGIVAPIGQNDLGLMLTPGNTTDMNTGPGIMLGLVDLNTIGLRTRSVFAAAYDSSQSFTLAQLGLTTLDTWIDYELRIIGADGNGPAILKAYVNGKQVGNTLNFGDAAGVLPGPGASGGGFQGYVPQVRLRNLVYSYYVRSLTQIWAPDEASAVG